MDRVAASLFAVSRDGRLQLRRHRIGQHDPGAGPLVGGAGHGPRDGRCRCVEGFERAVAAGTRLRTGQPGPLYWQQWSEYRLKADLNPVSKRLTGQGTITYHNRSPNALDAVYVQLLGNLFSPSSRHNTDVPWSVEGVELSKVVAQGTELSRAARGRGPATA